MRQLLALILSLSALAVPALLAGCADNENEDRQAAPAATATPTEEAEPRGVYGY